MKITKLLSAMFAAGFGLALASGSASALTWFSPVTTFEDDNLDYVFDVRDGQGNLGTISIGDRFVSVLKFNQTTGILAGQGPDPITPAEITGVADVTIVGFSAGNWIYAPTGATGLLGSYAPGTAIAMFIDTSPDLNVIGAACGTRATCFDLAGLGVDPNSSLWLTAGFFGDADALWVATAQNGGDNYATVQGGNATTKFGVVNFSLDIGVNNTGKVFDPQNCAPFCAPGGDGKITLVGSADILGGQGLNAAEWTARSDTDAQVAPIPEPGTIALLGVALAGLGALRRRSK